MVAAKKEDSHLFGYRFDQKTYQGFVSLDFQSCLVEKNTSLAHIHSKISADLSEQFVQGKIGYRQLYMDVISRVWDAIKTRRVMEPIWVRVGEGAPLWRGLSVSEPSHKRLVAKVRLNAVVEEFDYGKVRWLYLAIYSKLLDLGESPDRCPSVAQIEGLLRRAISRGEFPYEEELAQAPSIDREHPIRIVTSERVGEILVVCSHLKPFQDPNKARAFLEKLMVTSAMGGMQMPLHLNFGPLIRQIDQERHGPAEVGVGLPFVGLAGYQFHLPKIESPHGENQGWYFPLVREMVGLIGQKSGCSLGALGREMPEFSLEQINVALDVLTSKGFIQKKNNDCWSLELNRVAPDYLISGMQKETYSRFLLLHSEKSIFRISSKFREVHACTLSGNMDFYDRYFALIKRLLSKRKVKIAPRPGDGIYQLSFQFFPYTLSEYELRLSDKPTMGLPKDLGSEWIMSLVYDLVSLRGFRNDYEWVKDRLYMDMSQEEYHQAIDQLIHIKLLSKDDYTGNLHKKHHNVETGHGKSGQQIKIFHKTMLKLSCEIIARLPAERIGYHAALYAIGPDEYHELVADIHDLFKTMLQESEACSLRSQVFQLNCQFYPRKLWEPT